MANSTAHYTVIRHVNRAKDDILQIQELSLDEDIHLTSPPSNPLLPANIPKSARNFSPLYQLLPKSCPRSSSLESKELMLSKADTTVYTFLTSTQVNPIGPFPLSCAFQSIQMTSLDPKPPLLSAVCYTVNRSQHTRSGHLRL